MVQQIGFLRNQGKRIRGKLLPSKSSAKMNAIYNRPFYRYGGHIELIRFKEYYRMPMGHEHISFVLLSAFWDIFA